MFDLDKKVYYGRLYDFYGNMLTDNQRDICTYFFEDDYNLTETGEALGVTKQAVRDILNRTTAKLDDFETRLGLLAEYERMNALCKDALEKLNSGDAVGAKQVLVKLQGFLEE